MPELVQIPRVLSGNIRFFREGDPYTKPTSGICGQNAKPDGDDPAYIDLGPIEDGELEFSGGTDYEIWRPSPGRLLLWDVITTKEKWTLRFTALEMSPLAIEALFRAGSNLSGLSGQFNPMAGSIRKGWLHAQLYDQDDNLVLTFDNWCRLKCTGGFRLGEIVKPTFEALMLYSQHNTALIGS